MSQTLRLKFNKNDIAEANMLTTNDLDNWLI